MNIKSEKIALSRARDHVEAYFAFSAETNGLMFPLDPSHFPSWLRLSRVLSWVNRFIENYQQLEKDRIYGELLSTELKKRPKDNSLDMPSIPSSRMNG